MKKIKKDKESKDVHTELCCKVCGCKYCDENCPVVKGIKVQSFSCGKACTCEGW